LVNPKYATLGGLPCAPSLAALEAPPDVVIVMLVAARLPELIEQAVGSAALVVVGDLVRREGEGRAERSAEIVALARARGIRLVGPQCVGILSPAHGTSLSISSALASGPVPAGRIALVSQSGGIAGSVVDRARDAGVGFSRVVSTGEEADLAVEDYLEYLVQDPATDAISIYIESLRDPPRFLRLAEAARSAGKPLLLLAGGVTEAGAAAALSHSGRLTGRHDVRAAVLARAGVVLVDDIDDLWLAAGLLARYRLPPSGGLGACSMSGGYTAVMADRLAGAGLPLAAFAAETRQRLVSEVAQPNPANPVDVCARPSPGQEVEDVARTLAILDRDDGVAAQLYAETLFLGAEKIVPVLAKHARTTSKPFLACWQAGQSVAPAVRGLAAAGVAVCSDLQQAVRTLAVLFRWRALQSERADARAVGPAQPAPATGPVAAQQAAELLRSAGVSLVGELFATTPGEAAEAARRLGFPVVLKGDLPGCLHKTELGLVRLGLGDAAAVEAAATAMRKAAGEALAGFTLQPQLAGRELIVGVVRDAAFGPALLLAWGGIYAEAMTRRALLPCPIDAAEARSMIEQIDPRGILRGYRTGDRMAVEGLAELLVAVSGLAAANPWLAELDLNPVIVTADGCCAVDWVMVADRTTANR
jgi:acyl-CoA synthetase (NDP forming)